MQAKYDARNPRRPERPRPGGTQLRPFPHEVMDACYKAANELYAEICQGNAEFKKIHEPYMNFRGDQYLWWRVAERTTTTS